MPKQKKSTSKSSLKRQSGIVRKGGGKNNTRDHRIQFLQLVVATGSRAVFVIVSGLDGKAFEVTANYRVTKNEKRQTPVSMGS